MTFRLGVMGGTFDPIHHGHLVAASEVAHMFSLDEVVFVPTGFPWQKAQRKVTDPEIRFRMTSIATEPDTRFSVSRADIDRPGPTYAVDTLRDLRRARPEAKLHFITGSDVIASILTWRDPDEVLRLAHLVGVSRAGHAPSFAHLPPKAASLVEIPALAISSTDCRARVARGAPIKYLVPDAVEDFISTERLYQTKRL